MKSKILFTDIDDTLLNGDKSISGENRDAIRRLLEEGHYFVLVTGRPIATGKIVIKELGLTHIFLLTDNNVPAYEFYKKCGFYELKRNAAFAKEL